MGRRMWFIQGPNTTRTTSQRHTFGKGPSTDRVAQNFQCQHFWLFTLFPYRWFSWKMDGPKLAAILDFEPVDYDLAIRCQFYAICHVLKQKFVGKFCLSLMNSTLKHGNFYFWLFRIFSWRTFWKWPGRKNESQNFPINALDSYFRHHGASD